MSEQEKIDWIEKLKTDHELRMRAEKMMMVQEMLEPENVTLENLNEKNNETLEKLKEISSKDEDPMVK